MELCKVHSTFVLVFACVRVWWLTYIHCVRSFLCLIADLARRGEPHKVGHLHILLFVLEEVTDNANPSFISTFSLEQDRIAQPALEFAHPCTHNVTRGGYGR